jgi:hypothetical protein
VEHKKVKFYLVILFISFSITQAANSTTVDIDELAKTHQCYAGGYKFKEALLEEKYQFSDFLEVNPACVTDFPNNNDAQKYLTAHNQIINFKCKEDCPEIEELIKKFMKHSKKVQDYIDKVNGQRMEEVFKKTSTTDANNTEIYNVNEKTDTKGTQIRSISLANLAVLCGVSDAAIRVNPLFKLKAGLIQKANLDKKCIDKYKSGVDSTGVGLGKSIWIEAEHNMPVIQLGYTGSISCVPFYFKVWLDGKLVMERSYTDPAEIAGGYRKDFVEIKDSSEKPKVRYEKTYLCPDGVQVMTNATVKCGPKDKCGEDAQRLVNIINIAIKSSKGIMTHNWMRSMCYRSHYGLTVGEMKSYTTLSKSHETNKCKNEKCTAERIDIIGQAKRIKFKGVGKIELFIPVESYNTEPDPISAMLGSIQLKTGKVNAKGKKDNNFLSKKGWFNNSGEDGSGTNGDKEKDSRRKKHNLKGYNSKTTVGNEVGANDGSFGLDEQMNGDNKNKFKKGEMGNIEYILKDHSGISSSSGNSLGNGSNQFGKGKNFEKGREHFLMFKRKYCKKNKKIPELFSNISQRYCLSAYPIMLKN